VARQEGGSPSYALDVGEGPQERVFPHKVGNGLCELAVPDPSDSPGVSANLHPAGLETLELLQPPYPKAALGRRKKLALAELSGQQEEIECPGVVATDCVRGGRQPELGCLPVIQSRCFRGTPVDEVHAGLRSSLEIEGESKTRRICGAVHKTYIAVEDLHAHVLA